MSDNTEISKFDDPESLFPLARDQATTEPTGANADHRFVLDAAKARPPSPPGPPSLISPRETPDNDTDDDSQQQHPLPLGVELTGHRLLTAGVILGLGIPMAVYSYNGQSLFSTRLDWVVRIICTLLYAFLLFFYGTIAEMGAHRLSLLGLIKANHPELAPLFFQTDLSPYILGILRYISRSECACLANRRTDTDCVR
jgi:hypothetical protein